CIRPTKNEKLLVGRRPDPLGFRPMMITRRRRKSSEKMSRHDFSNSPRRAFLVTSVPCSYKPDWVCSGRFWDRRSAKMKKVSRRSTLKALAAGAVTIGRDVLGGKVAGGRPKAPKQWDLEGELNVHPKYLYRYYLVFGDGQKCALYASDHSSEPDQLARLKNPVRVRVRGVLGTAHHPGGIKENPSPFPETWTLYMDVHEVEVLK